ncbi:MAG: peptidoglycan DD-metalloendopeptidase family protein [Hominenteromicrobium sp.]
MAMHMKSEQEEKAKKGGSEKRGFYIALAVCLTAIGIAAWSTYDTVSGFLEPVNGEAESAGTSSASPAAAASPAPAEDDPESSVSAGHAQGTASEIVLEPDPAQQAAEAESEPEPAEAEPEEAPAEETVAEPDYTVSDRFLRPVGGDTVLTPFSEAPVYSETMRDYRAHMGADYAAEHGETVKAAANGIVRETYTDMLLGNTIVIEHGAYTFRYCGLGETFLVDPGEVVSAGQDIGSVTAAPFESAMASHLHLEVIQDGKAIDPESLLP